MNPADAEWYARLGIDFNAPRASYVTATEPALDNDTPAVVESDDTEEEAA